jgi:uncharacterized protein YbjT (DUF2867 family)
MRIFLAGATGVIGIRLVPLLVADAHTVAAMTRSPEKIEQLRARGAEPVVCYVLDRSALVAEVTDFNPDAILHQVTDLPDGVDELPAFAERNDRIRAEGTGTWWPPPAQQAPDISSRGASLGDLPTGVGWSTNTSASCSRSVG